MSYEERLERLIRAGWNVIERDFDESAYLKWREEAARCLRAMLGPENYYYRQFENRIKAPTSHDVLAGGGILEAARVARKSPEKDSQAKPGMAQGARRRNGI